MLTTTSTLVVGTDGSPSHDQRVRDAARLARSRDLALHVVCSVRRLDGNAQRKLDDVMPADMAWARGAGGQREAAVRDVHSMVAGNGLDLQVTASSQRLGAAVRRAAGRINGEVYGAEDRRIKLRLPALRVRARATA